MWLTGNLPFQYLIFEADLRILRSPCVWACSINHQYITIYHFFQGILCAQAVKLKSFWMENFGILNEWPFHQKNAIFTRGCFLWRHFACALVNQFGSIMVHTNWLSFCLLLFRRKDRCIFSTLRSIVKKVLLRQSHCESYENYGFAHLLMKFQSNNLSTASTSPINPKVRSDNGTNCLSVFSTNLKQITSAFLAFGCLP